MLVQGYDLIGEGVAGQRGGMDGIGMVSWPSQQECGGATNVARHHQITIFSFQIAISQGL